MTRWIRRGLGRFGLHVVAIVLALSGLLRMAGELGEAWTWAGFATPAHAAEGAAEAKTEAPEPAKPANGLDLSQMNPEGLGQLLKSLTKRQEVIETREAALAERMRDLSVAEKALEENLKALQMAEERLKATLALADGALEGDVGHLTKVYESMKPKQAATLFERMDPKFAAGFLARMTPAAASDILAGMTPESAYAISLIFAGRHADVPTE